jgi:hypothetical protein
MKGFWAEFRFGPINLYNAPPSPEMRRLLREEMTMDRVLIIDADSLVYSHGFTAQHKIYTASIDGNIIFSSTRKLEIKFWVEENKDKYNEDIELGKDEQLDPLEDCLAILDATIERMLYCTKCSSCVLLLTDGGNTFRDKLATIKPYKGNRDPNHKPTYYDEIREHLVLEHDALLYNKWEADDAAGMLVSAQPNAEYIIVSIDKDLDQLPGLHVDPKHIEDGEYWVSPVEAWCSFYAQMLSGDSSDNIKGLSGIGPVKAAKLLHGCETPEKMCQVVWHAYQERYSENALQAFRENADLLYLLRHRYDQYTPHCDIPGWVPYPNGVVDYFLKPASSGVEKDG